MDINVYNNRIEIENYDYDFETNLKSKCKYTNKSAMFQIKRLQKSYYMKPQYDGTDKQQAVLNEIDELKNKMYGNILEKKHGKLILPSGMVHFISDYKFNDFRTKCGSKISIPYIKALPTLRDYQNEAVTAMESNYRGIINMSMGLGKTLCAIHAIKKFKVKTLVVVPTENIAKQFHEEMVSYFGDHKIGLFSGKTKKIKDVTIGIANSVNKHIDKFKEIDLGLVIFDEAHHTSATTFFTISRELSGVGRMFGLTATNFRSDGLDILISAYCGDEICTKDIKFGIDNGWLAEPHFLIRKMESGILADPKEKLKAYQTHVVYNKIVKDQIFKDAKGMIDKGYKTLVVVQEIAHGKELAKELDIPFAQGSDPNTFGYIKDMGCGKLNALVATSGVISEGVNINCMQVLILATFGKSEVAVTQGIGRAMRKAPGKDKALIIDYDITNSTILSRYCKDRVGYYKKITKNIRFINGL